MIKFIISGYRYWDKTNGNSYHLGSITSTKSGRSIHFYKECEGNIAGRLRGAGFEWSDIFTAPFGELSYRE